MWFNWLVQFKVFEALRHPQYRLLWISHVFSAMGTWMDQVSRGWLIYELTNSSFQLGLVRGVQALPILLLSPIAGSTADRYSGKSQVMVALVVDAFFYGVLALLIFTGSVQPWHVYASAVCMASVWTFQQPSRAAMVSDSVPPGSLTNAIGLNAMMFNVARITGPAVAGNHRRLEQRRCLYGSGAILHFGGDLERQMTRRSLWVVQRPWPRQA